MLVARQKPVIRIMGLAAALGATPLPGQLAAHSPRADATLASAIAARHIVERGIAALGGQAALDSVSDMVFSLKGFRTDLGQAMAPNLPYTTELVTHWDLIEPRSGRFVNDVTHDVLGYAPGSTTRLIANRTGTYFVRAGAASLASYTLVTFGRPVPAPYRYPAMMLPLVLGRATNLRNLGTSSIEGRKMNVVAYPDAAGTTYTLSFDAATGLLTRISWLVDEVQFSPAGAIARELTFSDYRSVGGIKSPFHHVVTYGGEPFEDLRVTNATFNTHPGDSLFAVSTSPPSATAGGGGLEEVSAIAPDVYFVRASYNSVFVVFNEYVLVLEAPRNDALTQATIANIKKTAPGKPIRYVIPTHWHYDHLGGIRGYIAEGTTVVTTPGIRTAVAHYANTSRALQPDYLELHPRPLQVETFTDKRVFDDGIHRVEVYNIGPNPHASDLIVAYIPAAKTLYEADALDIDDAPSVPPKEVHPTAADLARKIQALGLDVETIIPAHGRKGTIGDLTTLTRAAGAPPR
jgi:glyoxylase-like metal-dependent hydrolase (beta-lactamase superfamily II)